MKSGFQDRLPGVLTRLLCCWLAISSARAGDPVIREDAGAFSSLGGETSSGATRARSALEGVVAGEQIGGGSVLNESGFYASLTGVSAISSVSGPVSGFYRAGQNLDFSVTFREPVFVDTTAGSPAIALTVGVSAWSAAYVSGSGSAVLLFRYTVQAGETDADGVVLSSPILLNNAVLRDSAGNNVSLAFASPATGGVIVDTTAPTMAISNPSGTVSAAGAISYTVTYADANFNASTLAAADITLNKTGTASGTVAVSGSGAARTVTISNLSGDGTVGISVANGTASDKAGNPAPGAGPSATFIVDNTRPGIQISAPSSTLVRNGTVAFTIRYSDANFDFSTLSSSDIVVNRTGTANASLGVLAGSGNLRTVELSGFTGDGTVGISIAAGTARDKAANLAPAAGPSQTFTVDTTPPSISISAPSVASTQNGPVSYPVNYAGQSTVSLSAGNVILNRTGTANGTVTVAGAGSVWIVTLAAISGDGTLGISLAAGTAADFVGNSAPAAGPSATFGVDHTPPAIAIGPIAGDDVLNAAESSASLTISGTTSGAENGRPVSIGLNGKTYAGAVKGNAWSVLVPSADLLALSLGQTYTVTANVSDAVGNAATAASRSLGVDRTAPAITQLAGPSAGYYRSGSALVARVTYDEPVFVDLSGGTPSVTVRIGLAPRRATYTTGSGSRTLEFSYTINNSETDDDGVVFTSPIQLQGTTIRDVAGNDASLNFTALTASGVLVDTTHPTVTISEPLVAIGGGFVNYNVTYSDAHFHASTLSLSDITLVQRGQANGTLSLAGSGSTWTVTVSSLSGNGALAIKLNAGTASDLAGNAAQSAGPSESFSVSGGVGLDGYVAGGTIFFDANNNRRQDPGEPFTTTDNNGRFQLNFSVGAFDRNKDGELDASEGVLVLIGGTDISTGLPLKTPLTALFGASVVTPLTTLITAVLEANPAETAQTAQTKIKTGLGLTNTVELNQYDPLAAVAANDVSALKVLNAGAKVQDSLVQITALLSSSTGTNATAVSREVGKALATQIISGTPDLAKPEVVQSVIQKSSSNAPVQLNAGLVQDAAQLIADNNAAKNGVTATNLTGAQAVLEIAKLQGAAQRQQAEAMTEAAAPGVNLSDAIAILAQAEAALATQVAAVGVVDGQDTRPGQFNFDAAAYSVSTIGQGSARITVVRSGGNSGAGKVAVKLGTAASPEPVVIEFANRETSQTVDVLPVIRASAVLSGLSQISLRLQAVAGGGTNAPTIGTNALAVLAFPSNAPAIISDPEGVQLLAGDQVAFTVAATGTPQPRYQWMKDGKALPGQTNAVLVLLHVQPGDAGSYQATASNTVGSVTSAAAVLRVIWGPVISGGQSSLTVVNGVPVSLSFVAEGSAPLQYQWSKNGVILPGRTNLVLNLGAVTVADSGSYSLQVKNDQGTSVSRTTVLTVTELSIHFLSIQRLGDGSVNLAMRLPLGRRYRLEESSDFRTWTTVGDVTPQSEVVGLVIPTRNISTRYFRASAID